MLKTSIKILALLFLQWGFAHADWEDELVSRLEKRLSVRFLVDYNFMSVWNSAHGNDPMVSNRPVDVGFGFGYDSLFTLFDTYWDFSLKLKLGLPFTTSKELSRTQSFDTGLEFYPGNWWLEFRLRYYSGFTVRPRDGDDMEGEFVDLAMLDMYYSMLWMVTAGGKFSLRSAYLLDRRQKVSAGSLVAGWRLQRNMADDRDEVLHYYGEQRVIYSFWHNLGYTYTWVFSNRFFVNLWGVLGVALTHRFARDNYRVFPESDVKAAVGRIGEKWAWNMTAKVGYSVFTYDDYMEQKFTAAYEVLVVRRF